MKISEIEKRTGMDRTNIRFYEREGLINLLRAENGYREFTEEDLETLLRIKLLRSIHLPISEIKALLQGEISLSQILDQQIHVLGNDREDIGFAQEICRVMKQEESSLFNLDAKKYLDQLEEKSLSTGTEYFSLKQDQLSQVHSPWRRFFARTLDFTLYSIFVSFVQVVVFHQITSAQSAFSATIDGIVVLLLMLFVEPLLLTIFGTTPGKAVFGLRLESHEGGKLTYYDAFMRTFGMLKYGMGFQIPFYNIYRHVQSYKACNQGEILPWDELVSYTLKDKKVYRSVLFVGAEVLVFVLAFVLVLAERIPPNGGELTVAEFAENYEHYQKLLEFNDERYGFDGNGQFIDITKDNVHYLDIAYEEIPFLWYELSNGHIKSISFDLSIPNRDETLMSYNSKMLLTNLALVGAQKDMKLFSSTITEVIDLVYNNTLTGFTAEKLGIEMTAKIMSKGYKDFGNVLIPERNSKEYKYEVSFSASKP